jgi:hypothetical protein
MEILLQALPLTPHHNQQRQGNTSAGKNGRDDQDPAKKQAMVAQERSFPIGPAEKSSCAGGGICHTQIRRKIAKKSIEPTKEAMRGVIEPARTKQINASTHTGYKSCCSRMWSY